MKHKKKIRQQFRDAVFKRDLYMCRICFKTKHLEAHHITDRKQIPNGGYILENGITMCPWCHLKAEIWHMTKGKNWEKGFHPDDLYKLIGSSLQLAIEESRKLL